MTRVAFRRSIQRVDRLPPLDGADVARGVIIAERFCVIGDPRVIGGGFSVSVTDLERVLGEGPHHRVDLHVLPRSEAMSRRLLAALEADDAVQPRALALLGDDRALLVVAESIGDGGALEPRASELSAPDLAAALSMLLSNLHAAGVTGVRFDLAAAVDHRGSVRLADYGHLRALGADDSATATTAREDVAALMALLRGLRHEGIAAAMQRAPTSAAELYERCDALVGGQQLPWSAVLPAEPPFVGRDASLRAALAQLREARVARPSLLLLKGPAGAGKSRLLRQLALELSRGEPALALFAEFERGSPNSSRALFSALDALAEAQLDLRDDERAALLQRLRDATGPLAGVLERVAPALAAALGAAATPPPITLGEDFVRHAAVLADALAAVGTPKRPALVLVDNVDVADSGSLAVLARVLSPRSSHHTMIVATTRGSLPSAVAGAVTVSDVGPLATEEVAEVIARALPGEVADIAVIAERLRELSAGLPLTLWSQLQQWVESGALRRQVEDRRSWRLGQVPSWSAPAQLYMQRLEAAGEDERWLAVLAAALGGPVTPTLLASLAGWDAARTRRAVEGLTRLALLVRDTRGALRFCHGTVRQGVAARLVELSRAAHARLLEYFADSDSLDGAVSPARCAYHAELARADSGSAAAGAGAVDESLADRHLAAGNEMLGIFDLERATWHFDRAARRSADETMVARALEGASSAALLQGRVGDACTGYALALYRYEKAEDRVGLATRSAYALMWRTALGNARLVIDETLALIGMPLPRGKLGRFLGVLGAALKLLLPPGRRLQPLRAALCGLYPTLIAGLVVGDPSLIPLVALRSGRLARGLETASAAKSLAFWASVFGGFGRYDMSRRLFESAARVADAAGDPWTVAVVAHMRAHTLELPSGLYAEGMRSLDDAVAGFRRTGDLSIAGVSLCFKAAHGRDCERASELLGWLDEGRAAIERQGTDQPKAAIAALRSLVLARCGEHDLEHVAALARDLLDVSTPMPDHPLAYAYLIEAFLEQGEGGRARSFATAALDKVKGGVLPAVFDELHVAVALAFEAPALSRAQRRLGRRARRRVARRGRRVPALASAATYLEARQAALRGKVARARRLYVRLIEQASSQGQGYLVLEAHRALGQLCAATDVLAAAEHVRRAKQLAEQLELGSPRAGRYLGRGREAGGLAGSGRLTPRRLRGSSSVLEPSGPEPADRAAREEAPQSSVSRASRAGQGAAEQGRNVASLAEIASVLAGPLAHVADVELSLWPAVGVRASEADLELLLTNLLMTARDAGVLDGDVRPTLVAVARDLDGAEAARLSEGDAGRFVRFELRGAPLRARASTLAGMAGCRQAAELVGGFIQLESSDEHSLLSAYVPRAYTLATAAGERAVVESPLRVVVLGDDERACETVLAALERFSVVGQRCAVVDVDVLARADVIFASPRYLRDASACASGAVMVQLLRRGTAAAARRPLDLSLRVPFTFDELESLLDDITSGRA